MLISIFSLFVGSLLLYFGAEWIIKGGVSISNKFGISKLVIGLTVVAFGTSLPELLVSLIAVFENSPSLAIGNVVGSNIANVGLVLGISALIFPISINYAPIRRDLFIYLCSCALFILFVFDGRISRFEGGFLFIGLLFYLVVCIKNPTDDQSDGENKLEFSMFKSAVYVLAGIFALSFGANFFVDGAIYLARFFGISEVVIGMSVVALGTSLPELATSAMAAFKKQSSISVGNIVGSNIFNILSILGITALFRPIDSPTNILNFEMPYMIAYGFVLILIAKLPQPVHRLSSGLLLSSYFLFIYLLF
ncbi:MAG: sodium:calcium antiporter [Candidatus Marinimicrobia bacterium]|nr:sodium:calcium antiporter [Candidatus Neomarinimicrobiota bacterium]|tara:strand:- start:180 stop:1100 length:921 start_codon:yes stop_codon:yes gene_type:complete